MNELRTVILDWNCLDVEPVFVIVRSGTTRCYEAIAVAGEYLRGTELRDHLSPEFENDVHQVAVFDGDVTENLAHGFTRPLIIRDQTQALTSIEPVANDALGPESWYAALTAEELAATLTRIPVWYAVISKDRLPSILANGFQAADEPRLAVAAAELRPRPGCVYLSPPNDVSFLYETASLTPETGVTIAVDLRSLHPGRIFPDEDAYTDVCGIYDPREVGLPTAAETGHATTGEWAEAVRLGEQPGVSAQALAGDRIAVRAPIPATLITPVELAPGEYLPHWEQRHLANRPHPEETR